MNTFQSPLCRDLTVNHKRDKGGSMQYQLTEEQLMLRDSVRRLSQEKIAPRAEEIDRTGHIPDDIVELFRANSLMGIPFPVEYGGAGGSFLTFIIVVEELAKACTNCCMLAGVQDLGAQPIVIAATPQQKQKYLTKIATGEWFVSFGLTEPSAGSDSASMKTRAVLDGDSYVLNGTKCFISNADRANVITIFAKTDAEASGVKGISAFVVERDSQGLSIGKKEDKMGNTATPACEVIMEDCRIPKENILGQEGEGFYIAMETLDKTRPMVASTGVGLLAGALDYAIEYAKERIQFGRPIATLQAIQFKLADIAMELEAARQLTYKAAAQIDAVTAEPGWQKSKSKRLELSRLGAMCKCFATDVAMRGTIEAAQVLGGYGYMKDYPMERRIRDAKLLQIVEGTNEIQRSVIAGTLLS